jgi:hypothetical protein
LFILIRGIFNENKGFGKKNMRQMQTGQTPEAFAHHLRKPQA